MATKEGTKNYPKIQRTIEDPYTKPRSSFQHWKKKYKSTHPLSWKQNTSYYFSQFCNSTSIHGIKYVGERGRFLAEKIVWITIVTIMCCLCVTLIMKSYNKWIISPVIVTFATTETPIWKIPFPAITICPEVKTDPAIFNYTDVLLKKLMEDNITAEEHRYFESFSLICTGIGHELTKSLNVNFSAVVNGSAIKDLVEAFPYGSVFNFSKVLWQQEKYPFNEVLSETFTSEGLCYTFNMLEFHEILKLPEDYIVNRSLKDTKPLRWSLDDGYSTDNKQYTYPRRTFATGISGGFGFFIATNHSHLDYLCGNSLQGFKVTLHHPSEIPDMDQHFRLPLDEAVLVGIKPRMLTMSEELKFYEPHERKCYYGNEKRLESFKRYTQNNCLFECLTNYTIQECKCAAFYMTKNESIPFCGPGSNKCIEQIKVKYVLSENRSDQDCEIITLPCDCLPSCTSLEYDVEISQTDWNWKEAFAVFERLSLDDWKLDYENIHISRLEVFYKEMQFLTSERHELYGYVDFFSSTGGLLGLFIGFSVTSAFEILYFLTLRLLCNVRKFGRRCWSGEQELINIENSEKTT